MRITYLQFLQRVQIPCKTKCKHLDFFLGKMLVTMTTSNRERGQQNDRRYVKTGKCENR